MRFKALLNLRRIAFETEEEEVSLGGDINRNGYSGRRSKLHSLRDGWIYG